ncbi:MAG: lamin tail domain-containing protein [Clostridiales bacterium]|nr:lamin tail domain-containing protein [Clostridiales bacterium]MDD7550625.1 lamin tail domain-containing protein [Clostridia bacterium]MDY5754159.1 lamin tail domain-containing protein [Eubacteriales bacterium]
MKAKKVLIALVFILLFAVLGIYIVSTSGGQNTSGRVDVRLNEIMLSNKGAAADKNGEFYDYIELYNGSDRDADISGYGLTDELVSGAKFVFPNGTVVPANGFIVVYCSGEKSEGLYASFKLSATDVVIFMDSTGRVIDSIDLISVTSGKTLSIDDKGKWVEMDPSPNYPNTPEGIEAAKSSRYEGQKVEGLYINEFMASNASTLRDSFGEYSDWIELYNATDAEIDLSGFCLSDDINSTQKFEFPEGVKIDAKGYLIVFCTGRGEVTENGEIHANFGLRKYKEDVVLTTPKGVIIDAYSYLDMQTDVSMARTPDGTGDFVAASAPTPGFPNNSEGEEMAMQKYSMNIGDLYISEMMGLNNSYLIYNGAYHDWVELHNKGSESINLSGYSLSTDARDPGMWRFGDVTIDAGQYLTIVCMGEEYNPEATVLQTDFNISAEGESVFLFGPEGELLDKLSCGMFFTDKSVGKEPDGTYMIYSTPTPKEANSGGVKGGTDMPSFTLEGGAYTSAQSIGINVPHGATVYYTTDGSMPTTHSKMYTGAEITITETTVLRAIAVRDGRMESLACSSTYLINDSHDLPVVSISVNQADFDNMYEDYNSRIELPMHFDYIKSNEQVFSHDGKIRIFGAYSRMQDQKGFALLAKPEAGKQTFEYPFFDNRPFTEYSSLVLRASGQEAKMTRMRDVVITSLLDDNTDLLVQAYQQCVVYVNGEYRGVYNLREKVNASFIAQHYPQIDKSTIDLLVGNGNKSGYVLDGSNEDYLALVEFAKTHDLSIKENYDHVAEQVDLENFAEYTAGQLYVANTDTGNIKFWRAEGTKWQWISYDYCWAMNSMVQGPDGNYIEGYKLNAVHRYLVRSGHGVNAGFSNALINALLENKDFRDMFLEKCAKMANEVFETQKLIDRVDECAEAIRSEMPRDTELWNGMSVESWNKHVERLRTFARERKPYFVYHLKQHFNLSSERCMELFGIEGNNPD